MIKRLIGVVFTIAVFAVVVAAAINWGGYRSMLFGRNHEPQPRQRVEHVDTAKNERDSTKANRPKKELTPEQIEARKRAIAKKKEAERAAAEKAAAENKKSELVK